MQEVPGSNPISGKARNFHSTCILKSIHSGSAYLYTASVSRQIKSEDHQSEDGLFDEENEAVCSFIAEALL